MCVDRMMTSDVYDRILPNYPVVLINSRHTRLVPVAASFIALQMVTMLI